MNKKYRDAGIEWLPHSRKESWPGRQADRQTDLQTALGTGCTRVG